MPLSFERLQAAHHLDDFDSGRPALDHWLRRHALAGGAAGSARTVVAQVDGTVIGYYALTVGAVLRENASERLRRGMPNYPIPVLVLARFALDRRWQGRGLSRMMLLDLFRRAIGIADEVGVRAIITNPLDDIAREFWLHVGFEPSADGQHLGLLIKDVRATLQAVAAAGRRAAAPEDR